MAPKLMAMHQRVLRPAGECHFKCRGYAGKVKVWHGMAPETRGGLGANALRRNKFGKIVSTDASSKSKARYENSFLKKWNDAIKRSRWSLGLGGFVKLNRGPHGVALYQAARHIMKVEHGYYQDEMEV